MGMTVHFFEDGRRMLEERGGKPARGRSATSHSAVLRRVLKRYDLMVTHCHAVVQERLSAEQLRFLSDILPAAGSNRPLEPEMAMLALSQFIMMQPTAMTVAQRHGVDLAAVAQALNDLSPIERIAVIDLIDIHRERAAAAAKAAEEGDAVGENGTAAT